MSINGLNGAEFGAQFKAYEQAMARYNDFGLKGSAVSEQFARYSEGIQYDQMKAFNKAQGREYARLLAEEQKALTQGLSGTGSVATAVTPTVTTPVTSAESQFTKIVNCAL